MPAPSLTEFQQHPGSNSNQPRFSKQKCHWIMGDNLLRDLVFIWLTRRRWTAILLENESRYSLSKKAQYDWNKPIEDMKVEREIYFSGDRHNEWDNLKDTVNDAIILGKGTHSAEFCIPEQVALKEKHYFPGEPISDWNSRRKVDQIVILEIISKSAYFVSGSFGIHLHTLYAIECYWTETTSQTHLQ